MSSAYPPAPVPSTPTLDAVRAGLPGCRACDLWEGATQPVAGEGPVRARLVLVGEQPGDREDRDGRPFVGPAGELLDRALAQAGIARQDAYVTNAVKHFRYKLRGKRRIHQTPDRWQITACLPWLRTELEVVAPEALIALGATAGQALFGSQLRVGRDRGTRLESELAALATVTAHPSAILRVRDESERQTAMQALVDDLSWVAGQLS
jgi:DNA polymerase